MSKAPIVVLEGFWWSKHEVPLVLPYFQALATSHRNIDLCHRTFRNAEDIEHYVSHIPKNAGAFLYFASHGRNSQLSPDPRTDIPTEAVVEALHAAKEGAISFVHFGCCEMVDSQDRRGSHKRIMEACGARWASGYTKEVPWLQSMFIELALVSEIFVPHRKSDGRSFKLKTEAEGFINMYEQAARQLGFSALTKVSGGEMLLPERLRQ